MRILMPPGAVTVSRLHELPWLNSFHVVSQVLHRQHISAPRFQLLISEWCFFPFSCTTIDPKSTSFKKEKKTSSKLISVSGSTSQGTQPSTASIFGIYEERTSICQLCFNKCEKDCYWAPVLSNCASRTAQGNHIGQHSSVPVTVAWGLKCKGHSEIGIYLCTYVFWAVRQDYVCHIWSQ